MKKIVIIFAIVGLVVGVAYASEEDLRREESKEYFKEQYREEAELAQIMSEAQAEVDAEFQGQTEQKTNSLEDKITWKQWTTWGAQAVTILVVFSSWYFVPLFTERRRKETEVDIWRHTAMSDAHRNLVTVLYEIEQYFNELIDIYGCDADDLPSKITNEELNRANHFVQQTNAELALMYMIMPDSKYNVIQETIVPNVPITLRKQRENLLVAMRKSQFPDTIFGELENIRFIHVLKRPDKKV